LGAAQQQILGDAGQDVEFVCCSLYLEWIFHNFSCQLYLAAREDKLLVGDSTGAPTRVVCGANTNGASTVCNCGGDRAVFPAITEEIVMLRTY
jgi:hypothetical protein